jgi:hypothetical protein
VSNLPASASWRPDDEQEPQAFAADDPVVTTGTDTIEVGKMLSGFVRLRQVCEQVQDQLSQ